MTRTASQAAVTEADARDAETDGNYSYLDVRYSERARPYTEYPGQLTEYLTSEYLAGYRGSKLLDLGCGRGEFLHGFARQGFDGVGIDRSRPSALKFNEAVIEADYERSGLPFADGEFSVLFSKSVFEHIGDISSLLRECQRVLSPSGRMIALVPDWTAQWRHFYDDWTHVRPFTLNGMRECVACQGFKIREKFVGDGFPTYIVGEIGINHNGYLGIARRLIDVASVAEADAVKFQKRTVEVVYTAEELAKPRENPFG